MEGIRDLEWEDSCRSFCFVIIRGRVILGVLFGFLRVFMYEMGILLIVIYYWNYLWIIFVNVCVNTV